MIGPKEPPLRYARGRMLVLGSCVLAVTAAAVLALGADDARLLRLGLVAALWAALIGTFTSVRARREPDRGRAGEAPEQVVPSEHEEIVALRGELQSLRETLRGLLGGDLLVERVALRTESTRLRPLPGPGAVAGGHIRNPDADVVTGMARSLPAAEITPLAQREPVEVASRPRTGWPDAGPGEAELDLPELDLPELDIFACTAAEPAGSTSFADPTWRPAVFSPSSWTAAVPSVAEDPPGLTARPVPGDAKHSSARTSRHASGPVATHAVNGTGSLGNGSLGTGSHTSRHSGGPRRAAGRTLERAGASGAQRPVSELLAAYGDDSLPRSRRRRTAD